jgi:serine/threonine-protein kinase
MFEESAIENALKEGNKIGGGGNGSVYRLDEQYVVKKLNISVGKKGPNDTAGRMYKRFKDEIKVVRENSSSENILPIEQISSLPEEPICGGLYYYVMPFAAELGKISFSRMVDIIDCFISLYETLNRLHKKGIAHRDIKPSNIYLYDRKYCFADFGLVYYPEKGTVTVEKTVGAWNTIAPEMERNPLNADPYKADIYSLAKTLWMILAKNEDSFEGQYNEDDPQISLNLKLHGLYSDANYLSGLNKVIRESTSNNPDERPTIDNIIKILKLYKAPCESDPDCGNFFKLCDMEWSNLIEKISPTNPSFVVWDSPDTIEKILKKVSVTHGLNHTFIPTGGGDDLDDVALLSNGRIKLRINFYKVDVAPKRLILKTHNTLSLCYFYLETYENEVFVFFAKNSAYNLWRPETESSLYKYIFDAYDAPHMKSSSIKEFDELISAIEEKFSKPGKNYNGIINKFFERYPKR